MNTEDIEILLDIDGVISAWDKAAAKTCGVDLYDPKIRADMKEHRDIERHLKGGKKTLWENIDTEGIGWWSGLELFSWSKRLVNGLKAISPNFDFLTSPSMHPNCAGGKVAWINKHFNGTSYLIGKNKHRCASPNSILIDDNKKKVSKFCEHGGHAFLWPMCFSLEDGDINIEEVFSDLHRMINKVQMDNEINKHG